MKKRKRKNNLFSSLLAKSIWDEDEGRWVTEAREEEYETEENRSHIERVKTGWMTKMWFVARTRACTKDKNKKNQNSHFIPGPVNDWQPDYNKPILHWLIDWWIDWLIHSFIQKHIMFACHRQDSVPMSRTIRYSLFVLTASLLYPSSESLVV